MPTALSDEELDALIARFDTLVAKSLRRAIKSGTTEALTAAGVVEDPYVRDGHGRFAPKGAAGVTHGSVEDVRGASLKKIEEARSSGASLEGYDSYTNRGYKSMNSLARTGDVPESESKIDVAKKIKDLDATFDEYGVINAQPVTVHRIVHGDYATKLGELSPGDHITERGYLSTTSDPFTPSGNFSGKILEITAPSGSKILAGSDIESELLFPRNTLMEYQGPGANGTLRFKIADSSLMAAAVPGPQLIDSTTGEPHTGGMIALIPANPSEWALAGGEAADSLHVTLAYLGDSELIPDHVIATLNILLHRLSLKWHPIDGKVFGASIWNADSENPSLNASIGGDGPLVEGVEYMHDYVWRMLFNLVDEDLEWEPPEQHSPWVAHMCLAYGIPQELEKKLPDALKLEGPIVFDRIRLALGGESTDYILGGSSE